MKSAADFGDLKANGYRNINELLTVTDRLHPGETLFGSYTAEVLLLAQDAAHFDKMQTRRKDEFDVDAYSHGPKVPTNRMLFDCLKSYSDADINCRKPNRKGNLFYANAIWLLKTGDNMQSTLTNRDEVLKVSRQVLEATVDGLPHLKLIVTLGKLAYTSLTTLDPSLTPDWNSIVSTSILQTTSKFGRPLQVGAVYHPGVRGRQARAKLWEHCGGAKTDMVSVFKGDFVRLFESAGIRQ